MFFLRRARGLWEPAPLSLSFTSGTPPSSSPTSSAIAASSGVGASSGAPYPRRLLSRLGFWLVRDPASVPTEFNDDINQFADAFDDPLGVMVFAVTSTVSCLTAAFVIGWQITAVICSTSPAIAVGIILMMLAIVTMMNETQAFRKERFVLEQHEGAVEAARKGVVRHGLELGMSTGWMLGIILWIYGLAFWFCAKLRYTCESWEAGDILSTFFAVLMGSCFVGKISPEISRYAGASYNVARFLAVLRHEGSIQRALKEPVTKPWTASCPSRSRVCTSPTRRGHTSRRLPA